ncbi:MAG: potassium-transporting ATPase subunit KdpC [Myxococcota bacterium]
MKSLRAALVLLLFFTVLCGLVYPLVMTGLAQVVMPEQANGRTVGAVGQVFTQPGYFHGRPSATTPPYNAEASTGTNHGPTNPAFLDAVKQRVEAVRAENPGKEGPVPVDLVTASGSGLDPHLSVAGAKYQVARVAKARGLSESEVEQQVDAHTEGRWLGLFGEPRVNVVRLNLALGPPSVAAPSAGP